MKSVSIAFGIVVATTCLTGRLMADPEPVAVTNGSVSLSPKNARIDFVGVHEGPKPDPRKGGFGKFSGTAEVSDAGALESVKFEIATASLWSENAKLTGHLKSPDFFDVRQHEKATFESTEVKATDKPGQYIVVGKFTLLGESREIKIPVNVSTSDDGMTLVSKFDLDRTQFGMTYGEGKIKKLVQISVTVGEATPSDGK